MNTIIESLLEPAPTLYLSVADLLVASLPGEDVEAITESLTEASVLSLWKGAVRAFPKTQRRQKVIDRVRTESVKWQPFTKLKIILASSKVLGERHPGQRQKRYRTNIMFRGVKFEESARKGLLRVTSRGRSPRSPTGQVYFEKLTFNDSVRVRCNCPDFRWRFNWETESENPSALFGPKAPAYTPPDPANYRGPANPSGLAGICKHIMNMGISLNKAGVIKMR